MYDTDPVLFEPARSIRLLSRGQDYSLANLSPVLYEVRTLLNYFDSIAVGVAQGVYIEQIVQENLRLIIEAVVDNFLTKKYATEIDLSGLTHLAALRNRWREIPATQFRLPHTT